MRYVLARSSTLPSRTFESHFLRRTFRVALSLALGAFRPCIPARARFLLSVTGRWLFSFAVSAPRPLPPADVGRAISARGREGSFFTFLTEGRHDAETLRIPCGVFLRDFLSFFSRVAARSRALLFLACTTCVSGRLVAKDFSCGGGRCVCRRRVSAVVACVLARLFSFAKKKPTVDLYRPPSTQCFPCNRKSIRR